MTPSDAWKIVQPELVTCTVDVWSEEDYEDEPAFRQIAADIQAGNITDDVLDEVENKMTFDSWQTGKLRTAVLVVLAANGRLDEFDPDTVYSRRPKTKVILGKRYIIG